MLSELGVEIGDWFDFGVEDLRRCRKIEVLIWYWNAA